MNSILALCYRELPRRSAYALATLIALAYLLWFYPSGFFHGEGAFFHAGDSGQHVSGWLFYAHDRWHFPLLKTTGLNYPEGVSIAFTDSIPLAALLFKPFVAWLPEGFQYIGLWHGVVCLSQVLAATYLLRVLGCRHGLAVVAGGLFALMVPALVWRLNHTALMTHSVLITALALYFAGRQPASFRFSCNALTALCIATLLIHPYLLAMAFAVFIALLWEQYRLGEPLRLQAWRLARALLLLAVVMAVCGYLGAGGAGGGFDYFSMNLASPFCGGQWLPCQYDATGGQYEGLNYFGAGTMLLLVCALWVERRQLPALWREHKIIILLCVLFTLYALSNKWFFLDHKLVELPQPRILRRVLETFRSSGRFFWPVGYLLLFSALAVMLRQRRTLALALVLAALLLQWADTAPFRNKGRQWASNPSAPVQGDWNRMLNAVSQVNFYPVYGCGGDDPSPYLWFQILAAYNHKVFNTGYIAHGDNDCGRKRQAFEQPFAPGQLYASLPSELHSPGKTVPAGFTAALNRGECVLSRGFVLCLPGKPVEFWRGYGIEAQPYR